MAGGDGATRGQGGWAAGEGGGRVLAAALQHIQGGAHARLATISSVPAVGVMSMAEARASRSQRLYPPPAAAASALQPHQHWSVPQLVSGSEVSGPNSNDLGDVLQWQQEELLRDLRSTSNLKRAGQEQKQQQQHQPPPPPPQQQLLQLEQQQQHPGPGGSAVLAAPTHATATDAVALQGGDASTPAHRFSTENNVARTVTFLDDVVTTRTSGSGKGGCDAQEEEGYGEEEEEEEEEDYCMEQLHTMGWCWHEVVAKRCLDPVTGGCVRECVRAHVYARVVWVWVWVWVWGVGVWHGCACACALAWGGGGVSMWV